MSCYHSQIHVIANMLRCLLLRLQAILCHCTGGKISGLQNLGSVSSGQYGHLKRMLRCSAIFLMLACASTWPQLSIAGRLSLSVISFATGHTKMLWNRNSGPSSNSIGIVSVAASGDSAAAAAPLRPLAPPRPGVACRTRASLCSCGSATAPAATQTASGLRLACTAACGNVGHAGGQCVMDVSPCAHAASKCIAATYMLCATPRGVASMLPHVWTLHAATSVTHLAVDVMLQQQYMKGREPSPHKNGNSSSTHLRQQPARLAYKVAEDVLQQRCGRKPRVWRRRERAVREEEAAQELLDLWHAGLLERRKVRPRVSKRCRRACTNSGLFSKKKKPREG